jgi:hypothetical protein
LDLQRALEGVEEALVWMATRHACDSLTVRNYKRMLFVGKTAQRASLASGYETSGDRICTKRWISCVRSWTSIPISAWSVYLWCLF